MQVSTVRWVRPEGQHGATTPTPWYLVQQGPVPGTHVVPAMSARPLCTGVGQLLVDGAYHEGLQQMREGARASETRVRCCESQCETL